MFYVTSSIDHKQYAIIRVRRENDIWQKPEIASFSGKYPDMGPSYAPDGKILFFTSKRPSVEGTAKNDNYDIWMVRRLGDDWSEPANLGSPVNSDKNEIFPSVAAPGDSAEWIFTLASGPGRTPGANQ